MPLSQDQIHFIKYQALQLRILSLKATSTAGSGHPTSCLSGADIVATLFFHAMQYDPTHFKNPENDRFILSKGHAAPLLYGAYVQLGLLSEHEMMTYRTLNSRIEGHPTRRFEYAEAATGSLGQGLSIGVGYDLNRQLYNYGYRTYVLMGDSEVTEGSVWEAAELGAYYKTDHLIGIIDINRLGQSTATLWGHDLNAYEKRWQAFGWHTIKVDGHSIEELCAAFDQAHTLTEKPIMILAYTFKGYPLHEVMDKPGFHGKAFPLDHIPELVKELQEKSGFPTNYQPPAWRPHQPPQKHTKSNESTQKNNLSYPPYKLNDHIATRYAYGQALAELGKSYNNLVVLDAEVKNSTYADLFEKAFPHRFFQCYIAEQNMIGMGVGLANQENISFISTFGAFFSRAFDQIRMAAIGQTPLRLCGSHSGVSIGEDGPSQMALEDIAMMRTLPDSIVLYPCDAVSTAKLVHCMVTYNQGVSYLRTTRPATSVIYSGDEEFHIGGCKVLKESKDDQAVIIGAGITLHEALKAHELLKKKSILTAVIDLYSVKPLDTETIMKIARQAQGKIIVVEDHYQAGGIGEAVTSALSHTTVEIHSLCVRKLPRSGSMQDQLKLQGIDANSITAFIDGML